MKLSKLVKQLKPESLLPHLKISLVANSTVCKPAYQHPNSDWPTNGLPRVDWSALLNRSLSSIFLSIKEI